MGRKGDALLPGAARRLLPGLDAPPCVQKAPSFSPLQCALVVSGGESRKAARHKGGLGKPSLARSANQLIPFPHATRGVPPSACVVEGQTRFCHEGDGGGWPGSSLRSGEGRVAIRTE